MFDKKTIASLNTKLPREELLRRSRVLVVDDEKPDIVDDLKKSHFAVDYYADIDSSNIDLIERPLYDLVLLDFGNVGRQFGNDEGLSLLRHIKRVNPAIVVLSYTSKALSSGYADFYRLSDGVLAKDAGIAESLEKMGIPGFQWVNWGLCPQTPRILEGMARAFKVRAGRAPASGLPHARGRFDPENKAALADLSHRSTKRSLQNARSLPSRTAGAYREDRTSKRLPSMAQNPPVLRIAH